MRQRKNFSAFARRPWNNTAQLASRSRAKWQKEPDNKQALITPFPSPESPARAAAHVTNRSAPFSWVWLEISPQSLLNISIHSTGRLSNKQLQTRLLKCYEGKSSG